MEIFWKLGSFRVIFEAPTDKKKKKIKIGFHRLNKKLKRQMNIDILNIQICEKLHKYRSDILDSIIVLIFVIYIVQYIVVVP